MEHTIRDTNPVKEIEVAMEQNRDERPVLDCMLPEVILQMQTFRSASSSSPYLNVESSIVKIRPN